MKGNFNARISKALKEIGGFYDKKKQGWSVDIGRFPSDIQELINTIRLSRVKKYKNLELALSKDVIDSVVNKGLYEVGKQTLEVYKDVLHEINDSMKVEFDKNDIEVIYEATDFIIEETAEVYTEQLLFSVKKFTDEQTQELREIVLNNFESGNRYEEIIPQIQNRFDVSQSKATFLGRQETSLLTTEFQKNRYLAANVRDYIWRTQEDGIVRKMHAHLDSTRHSWDNPPIVNEKGERKHPGQDYNCRCVAIPVIIY